MTNGGAKKTEKNKGEKLTTKAITDADRRHFDDFLNDTN